ncbi:MAG: glycoside hydrolase family 25 protein [Firmicutes bacterium]|nr:glycoside hydrolase family 25 protein [Bacillota bacterium]
MKRVQRKKSRKKRIFLTAGLLFFFLFIISETRTVKAAGSGTKGIDVSQFNGTVDWNQVKAQGIGFVMIKTGDGKDVGSTEDADPQFEANYAGAGSAGLKRGVYHVCCTTTVAGARAEAKYCLKILNGRKLEYPVAYDMELPGIFAQGKVRVTSIARAFCDEIKKAGYQPMIYASVSNLSLYYNWSKLTGIKVWAAHYGVDEPEFSGEWDMWQYSQSGKIAGAGNGNGCTDLNLSRLEAPKSIKLNKKKVTLKKGNKYQIKYKLSAGSYTPKVTFKSSRKAVATVTAKGKVKAVKKGTAKITVRTHNGKKAVLTVKVK